MRAKTSFIMALLLVIPLGFSAPQITVNSPTDPVYSVTVVPLNLTFNESVDVYKVVGNKNRLIATNVTQYTSNFYHQGSIQNHTFLANSTTDYSTSTVDINYDVQTNTIVNVTTCGFLTSFETLYVLQNNISSVFGCIGFGTEATGSTFDLNGFKVQSTSGASAIDVSSTNHMTIKDGNVDGNIFAEITYNVLVDNITFEQTTTSTSFLLGESFNTVIRNSNIQCIDSSHTLVDGSGGSGNGNIEMVFEDTELNTTCQIFTTGDMVTLTFRNSTIDLPQFIDSGDSQYEQPGIFRVVVVESPLDSVVRDQDLVGIPATLEVVDNFTPSESIGDFNILNNLKGDIIEGTDENGVSRFFLPQSIHHVDFNDVVTSRGFSYSVTAKGRGTSDTESIVFASPVSAIFDLNFPLNVTVIDEFRSSASATTASIINLIPIILLIIIIFQILRRFNVL